MQEYQTFSDDAVLKTIKLTEPPPQVDPNTTLMMNTDITDIPLLNAEPKETKKLSGDFATFANTIKAYIGSGILGMPYAFKMGGIWLGLGAILVMLFVVIYCVLILVECRKKAKVSTFGEVGYAAFGPFFKFLIDFMLMTTQTLFCMAYLIYIGENLSSIFPMVPSYIWVTIAVIPLIPLCFLRNVKMLAPFSVLAEICIFAGLGIILYSDFLEFDKDIFSRVKPYNIIGFPVFFGITVVSFEGIGLVLPLYDNMKNKKRYPFIMTLALVVIAACSTVFGLCGYLAFGENTNSVITLNFPKGLMTTLVKVALVIALEFTYPLQMFAASEICDNWFSFLGSKEKLKKVISKDNQFQYENFSRIILILLTAVIAMVFGKFFGLVIGLVGGLGGSILTFVFPAMMHFKLFYKEERKIWLFIDVLIVIFGIIAAAAATFVSVLDIIQEFNQ